LLAPCCVDKTSHKDAEYIAIPLDMRELRRAAVDVALHNKMSFCSYKRSEIVCFLLAQKEHRHFAICSMRTVNNPADLSLDRNFLNILQ
jgi:hypothetical protein